MKILLDPGHGGEQPGAVHGGVQEKDISLAVVLRAAAVLRELGHDVLLTRDRDQSLSLSERFRMIVDFKPEAFISVHCNAAVSVQAGGVETYYRDDYDYPLANSVQTYLAAYTGRRDRGVRHDIGVLKRRLAVLNDLETPACLAELGFLSNDSDRNYMASNVATLGDVLAHGIDDYAHKKAGTEKRTFPDAAMV